MSRTETYERKRADGSVAVITRDIDTGEKSVETKGGPQEVPAEAGGPAADGADGADGAQTPPPDAPERPSRGASLASWAEFADAVGFKYPEDATRDQIRDAYEAEHPAE